MLSMYGAQSKRKGRREKIKVKVKQMLPMYAKNNVRATEKKKIVKSDGFLVSSSLSQFLPSFHIRHFGNRPDDHPVIHHLLSQTPSYTHCNAYPMLNYAWKINHKTLLDYICLNQFKIRIMSHEYLLQSQLTVVDILRIFGVNYECMGFNIYTQCAPIHILRQRMYLCHFTSLLQ